MTKLLDLAETWEKLYHVEEKGIIATGLLTYAAKAKQLEEDNYKLQLLYDDLVLNKRRALEVLGYELTNLRALLSKKENSLIKIRQECQGQLNDKAIDVENLKHIMESSQADYSSDLASLKSELRCIRIEFTELKSLSSLFDDLKGS